MFLWARQEYLPYPRWFWEYEIHTLRLQLQTQQQYQSSINQVLSYENIQISLIKTCKKTSQLEFSTKITHWRCTLKFLHNYTAVLQGINKIAPKNVPNFSADRDKNQA